MAESVKKILGIDPGTNFLGYAVIETTKSDVTLLDIGALKIKNYPDHHQKLRQIYLSIQEIIERNDPEEMAIESPFYSKNVQSMLKLGRAQGVSIAAGITMGLKITEYSPKKIKLSVTGNGNASKEQVAGMLERILRIKLANQLLDATDALATAYCHFNQSSRVLNEQTSYSGWSAFIKANPGKVK